MARITVEDCLDHVDNRFELVMVGSKRARQIATKGKTPMVPEENDKPTVLALREIEEGFVNASILDEADEPEHDISADLTAITPAEAEISEMLSASASENSQENVPTPAAGTDADENADG